VKRTSDWVIALAVIACSAALLAALSFALTGNPFTSPSRTLRVQLPDITGLQTSSLVKYAGATAGSVRSVRVLTPTERLASSDPANAIELTLAIADGLPDFSEGTTATVSANTLLADKFVLLGAGDPTAPILANNALIPGTPPTTIDSLVQTIDRSLRSLDALLPTATDGAPNLLEDARTILLAVQQLIDQAGGTLTGADTLVRTVGTTLAGANDLIASAQSTLTEADTTLTQAQDILTGDQTSARTLIADLNTTATSLDSLATRANRLIADNADSIDATLTNLRVTAANLKVTATYAKALAFALTDRPQQIIWGPGRSPITVPTETQILRTNDPIPLN
jgi:ABC-type transporter Mla subunit MlaD